MATRRNSPTGYHHRNSRTSQNTSKPLGTKAFCDVLPSPTHANSREHWRNDAIKSGEGVGSALTLHPHEVRAYLAGRLGVIVRPVKPKRDGWEFQGLNVHGQALFYPAGDLTPETEAEYEHWDGLIPLPIPRGPFWGRETWATLPWAGDPASSSAQQRVIYRGDGRDADFPWRPPVTMPRAYSRISGTVGDSRVCRVGDVTGAEVFAWGRYNGFLTAPEHGFPRAQGDLRDFWQATYRDYDANPWVQVARIERSQ